MTLRDHMVWVDIETTGLDVKKCEIIEIGFCVTDLNFKIVKQWSSPVCSSRLMGHLVFGFGEASDLGITNFVAKLHGENGSNLFPEITDLLVQHGKNPFEPTEVFNTALEVLTSWGVSRSDELCGSSLRFDRNFLLEKYPKLDELFHYRSIDVSSDMAYIKKRYPDLWHKIENDPLKIKAEKHRVIPDLIDTINLFKRIDTHVFQVANSVSGWNG